MSDITPLIPRRPVPSLSVPLAGGGTFSIAEATGDPFTMIVVYRGLHCPICKSYLRSLEETLGEFEKRGIEVVAVSSDDAEKAAKAKADWDLKTLKVGYDLDFATARRWGLYVSAGRNTEPAHFTEPGLFLVKPDGTLYFVSVQSMPFARPRLEDLLPALDFVTEKDYPARGDVETLPLAAE